MLSSIISAKYPGINLELDCILRDDGGGVYIATWNRPEPKPTIPELELWAAANPGLILSPIKKGIIACLEIVFAKLACEITGEPEITPLLIAEWEEKERLFYDWIDDGQPEPTPDNGYSWAFNEAEQDPAHTGVTLLQEWGKNAIAWRNIQKAFAAYRQAKRAKIKTAVTETELSAIRAEIEPELRTMFGV